MANAEKKVRVRIAVAIDDTGLWSAAGNSAYENDDDAQQGALDYLPLESSERRSVVWVEADVPVPVNDDDFNGLVIKANDVSANR